MVKISWIILIKGEVKVGKSHLGMATPDSIMIDMTADSNARAAAYNVYGNEMDERYFKIDEDADDLENIIEGTDAKVVCLDEGRNLRNAYANRYLRIKKKEKVYPISEWAHVYGDIQNNLFRRWDGEKNFVITQGMKDYRIYSPDEKREVVTGKRITDGLNILPTLADVVLDVRVEKHKRRVRVQVNRFLDMGNDEVWVEYVNSIDDLFDKICENSNFKREMFV